MNSAVAPNDTPERSRQIGKVGAMARVISQHWLAFIFALAFVLLFYWLISRQYQTFDTRASDLERFNQAVWNTIHGRFLMTTVKHDSLLANHFSPMMASLAPLLLLWEDPRILALGQLVGLAVAGLLLYRIVYDRHPSLATWFLLAVYLNPAVQQVGILELRRITLAVPFLALALYGLWSSRRWVMVTGLLLALLCKEDVALIVAMFGVYLFFFERDRRWGIALFLLGAIWLLATLLLIVPWLTRLTTSGNLQGGYPTLSYYGEWGDSLPEIIINVVTHPIRAVGYILDGEGLRALWRLFLPLGLLIPMFAPGWFLLSLPSLFYTMLSGQPPMHRLEVWYLAPIIPLLLAAVAVFIARRPFRQARWLTVLFLFSNLIGFWRYGSAPLGGEFNEVRYRITDHHRRAMEIVKAVPGQARVAAQSAFTPLLAFREHIYVYPLLDIPLEDVDYLVLDRYLKSYPLNEIERNDEINNLLANPTYVVEKEVDGIFLMRTDGPPLPSIEVQQTVEEAILLERIEIAPADDKGYYRPVITSPLTLSTGQSVRVTLYFRALATPGKDRTVSVRIADGDGFLLAQQDKQPSDGARPTSWWEEGWTLRDTYYLTVEPGASPGEASLNVLLYDSYTQDRVPFDNGQEILQVFNVVIEG